MRCPVLRHGGDRASQQCPRVLPSKKKTKKNNNNNVCAYAEGPKFRIVQQTCNQIDQPSMVVIKGAEWLAVDGIYMYIYVIGYKNVL